MPTPANLVHQQSTSTGTGNLTLGAVTGRLGTQSFNSAFGTGGTDKFDYFIQNSDAAEWERGTGHLSDATTLVRDTVLEGTNGTSPVDFSAGTKDVTNDIPAGKQVTTDTAQTLTNKTLSLDDSTVLLTPPGTGAVSRSVAGKIGEVVSITDFGAVADGVKVTTGCGITASSQTLTAPSSTFAAGDVGKAIAIVGAGAAGANLFTTIASYTSATSVELTAAAGTTVSNGAIVFGTDNTSAIQAALNVGRRCVVPPGRYVTTAQLVVKSFNVLYGYGQPTIFPLISGASAIGIADLTTLNGTNRQYNIHIEHLLFDGAGSRNAVGVDLTQCSTAVVLDVLADSFSVGFRVKGRAYYNRLSMCTAQNCTTNYDISNGGADASGPNHLSIEYCRASGGDVGFSINDDGTTNINDICILHPSVEGLNASGNCFRVQATNLVRSLSIISPRIDVSNGSITGFKFDNLSKTDRVLFLSPHTSGLATVFSPAISDTGYAGRMLSVSPDKTLDGSKTWRILASSGVAASITGTTSETTLATITVPANALGANGMLRITTLWTYTNNSNTKTCRVRFGGTEFVGIPNTTTATMRHQVDIHNRNSGSSQIGLPNSGLPWSTTTGAPRTGTVNTTSDQDITLTARLANSADTITLESYTVECFAQ